MPSTRLANAVTDPVHQAPPASDGLRAPSRALVRTETRDRAAANRQVHRDEASAAGVVDLTLRLMGRMNATAIAREVEADPRTVRDIIKAARKSLADRAEFYVEAHAVATVQAAIAGNAKPAQWALEHIAEEDARIIDPPKVEERQAPATFNIGFKMGGIPEAADQRALPPASIDGETT